jgi:hypothetical protein
VLIAIGTFEPTGSDNVPSSRKARTGPANAQNDVIDPSRQLDEALARPRYGRSKKAADEERAGVVGHRHGCRKRSLTGTFGPVEIGVPRARLNAPEGRTTEWKSQALRAYQRRTLAADALCLDKKFPARIAKRQACHEEADQMNLTNLHGKKNKGKNNYVHGCMKR